MSLPLSPRRIRRAVCLVFTQVGSLEVGKRADIIIADGDPLQAVTNIRYMFINGQPVDVDDNKHTRLYRQYQQRLGGQ